MSFIDKKTFEENFVQKAEIMSFEEAERANNYISLYRSAYMAKDNIGILDKDEAVEVYYKGDSNLSQYSNDPGSSTNIIQPMIEGQVALMVGEDISIEAKPREPGDEAFKNDVEEILNFIFEKNDKERLIERTTRRFNKFGTAVLRTLYNPDALDGFGLPETESIPGAYVYVDPNIVDIAKIQEAEYIIETSVKSIFWARTQFGDEKAAAITPAYSPIGNEVIFGEGESAIDEESQERYLHIYMWIKEIDSKDKLRLRLVQLSGDGIILDDSFDGIEIENDDGETETLDVVFPKNMFPYFFEGLYEEEGQIWAGGDAELLFNTQDLINEIDDQIRINSRLTANPQLLVEESTGVDPSKISNQAGLRIPTKDIGGIKYLQPADMARTPIDRRNYAIERERTLITRFSDQMIGIRQKGIESATESLQLQQTGSGTVDIKKKKLQRLFSDAMSYSLELVKEYWTEEKVIRVLGENGELGYIFFKGSDLKEIPIKVPMSASSRALFREQNPDVEVPRFENLTETKNGKEVIMTKDAEFDVVVSIGAGVPQNKAFLLQTFNELHARGIISNEEYRDFVKKFLKLPLKPRPIEQQLPGQIGLPGQGELQNPQSTGIVATGTPGDLASASL